MIRSLEEFLKAYEDCFSANLPPDVEAGECFYDDLRESVDDGFDNRLTGQMENLGILYTFGGMLVINAMAIRVLKRMRTEGKDLTGEGFRREIEVSRDLYHLDEEAEMASY